MPLGMDSDTIVEDFCSKEVDPFSIPEKSWESMAHRKPGRKGRKFSFNKENYDRFKQDNNFKLEF